MTNFIPITIKVDLSSPLAVLDDWTPSIEAILEFAWLDERGLYSAHVNPEKIIIPELPIQRSVLESQSYWCCSSPHYQFDCQYSDRRNKRWAGQSEGYPVDWQGKRQKIQTDGGPYKSGNTPVFARLVKSIYWWSIGNIDEVSKMLSAVTSIGKHRGIGYGQVSKWSVRQSPSDYHLWGKNGQLMRPIPVECCPADVPHTRRRWAWVTPFHLPESRAICAMPISNILKLEMDFFNAW